MGLADADDRAGRRELEETQGESLEFRGARLIAVVNFPDAVELAERGEVDLDHNMISDIDVENCRVTPPPTVGESFKDSRGRFHRIKSVRGRNSIWHCTCHVEWPERKFLQQRR